MINQSFILKKLFQRFFIKNKWKVFGESVIGPLHVKAGLPNQDSWMARQYKWGNVVAVSDGLGSKSHSDHGSRAACLAVLEAARIYQKNQQAKIVDVLRLIHANWLVKTAPFSPADCSATCLFAFQIEGTITLGRLGDGMIIAFGDDEKNCLILSDNKQNSFSNYTYSLHYDFRPELWKTAMLETDRCKAVVLCTDGISDDLLQDKELEFAKDFVDEYAGMASRKRPLAIKKMLNDWPVPKHSDDKTIACLFKNGGSNEPKI